MYSQVFMRWTMSGLVVYHSYFDKICVKLGLASPQLVMHAIVSFERTAVTWIKSASVSLSNQVEPTHIVK